MSEKRVRTLSIYIWRGIFHVGSGLWRKCLDRGLASFKNTWSCTSPLQRESIEVLSTCYGLFSFTFTPLSLFKWNFIMKFNWFKMFGFFRACGKLETIRERFTLRKLSATCKVWNFCGNPILQPPPKEK